MVHCKQMKLEDIWRICNKIRAAIFRVGLNLWEYYLPLDPNRNCLISESKFVSVLAGPLKGTIGLSDQEIAEITDYFRVQDGRIFYSQMCQVIQDSVPAFDNAPLVTGLEWEDPLHVNRLSASEERRIALLIAKIAATVNMRKLVLRPYFQDYELISKNSGVVTLPHFARIMDYLQILLSADDFNLLAKKYLKNSYTFNYVAFVEAIHQAVQYFDQHGMLDYGGDLLPIYPGKMINAELPKLPRPEIGKITAASVFGKQNIFHPVLEPPKQKKEALLLVRQLQRHVLENRLRISLFFQDFDPLNSGKISLNQFHRGLDALGLSGFKRIYLSLSDIQTLIETYRDPVDHYRCCWRTFENDINMVFTTQGLERHPTVEVESPPIDIQQLPKPGGQSWQHVPSGTKALCEDAVEKVKERAKKRSIILRPIFRDHDKHNNGHVTRSQMRQSLLSNGILISDEEVYALEQRFNDDLGFNYLWFLKEVESRNIEEPLFNNLVEGIKRLAQPTPRPRPTRQEKDIVLILAKIKGKVVRERINIKEFMQPFDYHNHQNISRENFKRGLSNCRLDLTENEIDTVMDVFASPLRRDCVDFKRFGEVVEEAFTQTCLERAPLLVPLQHIPTKDCERNFLNFEERQVVSAALEKLAKKPDIQMNLMSLFLDYDKTHSGNITKDQFLKALTLRGMNFLISSLEFDGICKCFSYEKGNVQVIDYRAFIKALDILFYAAKYNPF